MFDPWISLACSFRKLEDKANALMAKNRRLRQWHSVLGEKIAGLVDVDLLMEREVWKTSVKELRNVRDEFIICIICLEDEHFVIPFGSIVAIGDQVVNSAEIELQIRPDLTREWRIFWDHQLYKVLEYQFRKGVAALCSSLSVRDVSMIIRQQQKAMVQFEPPLEEVGGVYDRRRSAIIDDEHAIFSISIVFELM